MPGVKRRLDRIPFLSTLWTLLRGTIQAWQEDGAARLAAAVSYYTAVSTAPLLIIVLLVMGYFVREEPVAQRHLIAQFGDLVGEQGALFIEAIIENADLPRMSSAAGLLSIAALLWGSTNVFAQLQMALDIIWGVETAELGFKSTVRSRLLSFAMVFVIGFLLIVSLIVSALVSAAGEVFQGVAPDLAFFWQLSTFVISILVITLLFAALFKTLPNTHVAWDDVWVGAAVTALLFTIGKTAIGIYLGQAGLASSYGAAGSVLVFLLWVYYSAQILFFGAEFTQVYSVWRHSRQVTERPRGTIANA